METAEKLEAREKDTLESEKKALLEAFRMIDASDFVYVYAKGGYIGKTVAMEIAYAHARGKVVVSSEEIGELSARALVARVVGPGKFTANSASA